VEARCGSAQHSADAKAIFIIIESCVKLNVLDCLTGMPISLGCCSLQVRQTQIDISKVRFEYVKLQGVKVPLPPGQISAGLRSFSIPRKSTRNSALADKAERGRLWPRDRSLKELMQLQDRISKA
jgi:hypothetical protein